MKWPSEEDEDGVCGYIKSDLAQESRNHAQISEQMVANMARVMITSENFGTKYILFQNWGACVYTKFWNESREHGIEGDVRRPRRTPNRLMKLESVEYGDISIIGPNAKEVDFIDLEG